MTRKPIAVSMTTSPLSDGSMADTIVVVCDDGAMFHLERDGRTREIWHRLPDVPQPADARR